MPRSEPGPGPVAVWRRMLETHADLVRDLEDRFRVEHGLTATEFDVLINVPPRGPIRHRDLLEQIVLSRSGLSRLLRRLDARGLVSQCPDEEDQRGVCVALTPAGTKLRREAARTNAAVVRSAFRDLSPGDLAELRSHLDRVRPGHGRSRQTDAPGSGRATADPDQIALSSRDRLTTGALP